MELVQVVSKSVGAAAAQVFSTMLSLEIENDPAQDCFNSPPFSMSGVCGNVSFAGRFTGAVYFVMTPRLSQLITGRIVGEGSEIKLSEENDVIGELTNMITGNLKSMIADVGFNCQLSIPAVIRGEGIHVSAKGFVIWVAKNFKIAELNEEFSIRVLAKTE